ncbi:flagellar assembly protein FliH [Lentibacillus salinarum]|uniref:Flagellar assembly protein FliH n=1 Tax=Lentibacillus salinarum TaxID=446820 RepID=A0ABW3ZPR1_9BACI
MSNIYPNQSKTAKERRINVRPISVTGLDNTHPAGTGNEDHQKIQLEIDQANEELQRIKDEQANAIKQTNTEIEAVKADWEKERQQYIEQARQEGYTAGFQQGKQDGFEHYQQLITDANDVVKAATRDYHKTLEQSNEQIVDLAIHIAEKIMRQQLEEQPETFMAIVQSAIKETGDKPELSLYLNPVNYDAIIQQKDELTRFAGRDVRISVYADETLNEGSCLIEHPFGQIDASIDEQLQELREKLHEVSMEDD